MPDPPALLLVPAPVPTAMLLIPSLRRFRVRETPMADVLISISSSVIMETWYWKRPSSVILDPCGMMPVGIFVISFMLSGSTTETVLGSMSPCRLKLTT